jgi:hypothetical protein
MPVNQGFPVYIRMILKEIKARVKRMPKNSNERFLKRLPAAVSKRSTNQLEPRYKIAAASVK